MSEPFLAEIRMMGFNFAPRGWALCDGQILPINQNQSLYSLLGTAYGGDGRTSFALPELRGRTPMHVGVAPSGSIRPQGQRSGSETVSLSESEMPSHTHALQSSTNGPLPFNPPTQREGGDPEGHVMATNSTFNHLKADNAATRVAMRTGLISNTGSGLAHTNMQPFTTISFCIALQGLFPPRN